MPMIVRKAKLAHRRGGVAAVSRHEGEYWPPMQALIEMIIGFIAMLAAAALAQFGVESRAEPASRPEVHRVTDCEKRPTSAVLVGTAVKQDC
ncbi:MAG: hypothetical protein V7672_06585 [Brevundimonas sp.]|uniref:hypothetical protein n=1 Tax=Brevundimonas sp. TaxID=1871086 RepID=UPI003002D938